VLQTPNFSHTLSPLSMPPRYDIGPFWSSDRNTDVQINVFVSDKHFQIDILAANLEKSPSLLEEYLRHIKRQDPEFIPDESEDAFVDPVEEIHEWALTPFLPIFTKLPPLDLKKKYTLKDCLYPETLCYTLQAVDDQLFPCPLTTTSKSRAVGAFLPPSSRTDYAMFPVYRADELQVPISKDSTALPNLLRKVLLKGQQVCFFKQILPGDISSTVRELAAYAKIQAAKFGPEVRTSQLLGVVEDEKTSRVVGLLLSYIECEVGMTLLYTGCDSKFSSLQTTWLDQMAHTLKCLHAKQIIWGDGKPDNVVIDSHNHAYIVDFGGGYTQGWVDKELVNTDKGDLQALKRISKYLL
jgi:hypothetical protein